MAGTVKVKVDLRNSLPSCIWISLAKMTFGNRLSISIVFTTALLVKKLGHGMLDYKKSNVDKKKTAISKRPLEPDSITNPNQQKDS